MGSIESQSVKPKSAPDKQGLQRTGRTHISVRAFTTYEKLLEFLQVFAVRFLCKACNTFVFDEGTGDQRGELLPGTRLAGIPRLWRCPVCGHSKKDLVPMSDEEFAAKRPKYERVYPPVPSEEKDLPHFRAIARRQLSKICAVNKVCDGNPDRLCMGMKYGKPIGFGGAGQGRTWNANFQALAKYRLKMRVLKENREPVLKTTFLGHMIAMPVMASSVSGARISMGDAVSEEDLQWGIIEGAKLFGTIGLSGNTVDAPDHPGVEIIGENGGWGIPVFKPQSQERLLKLFRRAEKANVIAIGVDLDGYGSTNWALRGKPLFRKSEKDLKELVDTTDKPVMFKGLMTVEDAAMVVDSGAKAMDVSNHGGRVMDFGQGVADVLPGIAAEFKGKITIMADGAVRTGSDVLRLLAMGADVVLIGRPMARMSVAGGPNAVKMYLDYVKSDFRMAMVMTGCDSVSEITNDILAVNAEPLSHGACD